jgi:hypothetical protein
MLHWRTLIRLLSRLSRRFHISLAECALVMAMLHTTLAM